MAEGQRKETFSMTPDRVIYECMSTVSDLIQRQLELFPCPTKRWMSPRASTEEDKMLADIPCEVKCSMRSLSEDMRALFQSVTSLVQCQDNVLDDETHNSGQNTRNAYDTSGKIALFSHLLIEFTTAVKY